VIFALINRLASCEPIVRALAKIRNSKRLIEKSLAIGIEKTALALILTSKTEPIVKRT